MSYFDAIKDAMTTLAQEHRTVFIGYNILHGSRAYGTLKQVPVNMCIETPVAENLMAGLATGMAMAGFRPVLFFERHDFILNALDCIVNHMDKMASMTEGQFKAPVIIRAVVGGTKPLYPGPQHIQDFTDAFKALINFPVLDLRTPEDVVEGYEKISQTHTPVMMVERRDLYHLS